MTEQPRTFRRFLRDYVDDLIRLATLAAICGGTLSTANSQGGWSLAVPVFVGVLTFAFFVSRSMAIIEYAAEHYPKSTSMIFVSLVLGFNGIASGGVFYLVGTVVMRAVHGLGP